MLPDADRPLTELQQTLAHRLFHLAEDTDRVGLHREATVLLTVAVSVLQGRDIAIAAPASSSRHPRAFMPSSPGLTR